MSPVGAAWRAAATLAAPGLRLHLHLRVQRGKEDAERVGERRGEAADRPPGRLFWLHAASVGETLSAIPVLVAMAAADPALRFLVTTGTRTAATLLPRRLPPDLVPRVAHRYAPLDVPAWVARFLDGWRPDAAAFVESELWPNLIAALHRRNVPLALVNARLSSASAARWRRWAPRLAAQLLGGFTHILAQSAADAERLRKLGAVRTTAPGNLKLAAAPLPADADALAALRTAIADRPVWLAASTHPGEEAIAAVAHRALLATLPDLLLVIAPRHPERGVALAGSLGAGVARRAAAALPGRETAIYVADTMGELGLFYRVAQVTLVGGSLVAHGGQNPLEPARLGCAILVGPHTENFAEPVARLLAAGGARRVAANPQALAAAVGELLDAPDARAAMVAAAAAAVAPAETLVADVADALLGLLRRD